MIFMVPSKPNHFLMHLFYDSYQSVLYYFLFSAHTIICKFKFLFCCHRNPPFVANNIYCSTFKSLKCHIKVVSGSKSLSERAMWDKYKHK